MIRQAVAIVFAATSIARAQSTATLGRAEQPWQFQITAGGNVGIAYDGSPPNRLIGASVSIRHPIDDGLVGLRASAWGMESRAECGHDDYRCGIVDRTRFLLVMIMADHPFHLPYDLTIEPVAGLGFAPFVQDTYSSYAPGVPYIDNRSSPPFAVSAGVGVRWRHLVVEQHFFGMVGFNDFLERTYSPFSVGVRF